MPFLKHNKAIAIWMIVFALIGFADATYLTIEHYTNGALLCGLTNGCDIVTTSTYSVVFGVPLALFGVLYYFSVIFGLVIYLDLKDEKLLFWLAHYTVLGFIVSIILIILQVFFLKSICIYCMGSAFSSTLIYYFGHQIHKRHKIIKS